MAVLFRFLRRKSVCVCSMITALLIIKLIYDFTCIPSRPVLHVQSHPQPPRLLNDSRCGISHARTPLPWQDTLNVSATGPDSATGEPGLPLLYRNIHGVHDQTTEGSSNGIEALPAAYVITPTYTRATQKAELLRLCYTLMHVPNVHWIVVEDSTSKTTLVTDLLSKCRGPSMTHLAAKQPSKMTTRHRGVHQRNAALQWIRDCVLPGTHAGGIYFADDDNTYDLRLFEAVRWTKTVSMWLVGLAGGALWEGPVCLNGKVRGWQGNFGQSRPFPVDMAAFSIGVNLLLQHPQSSFQYDWKPGRLETGILESLNITMDQLTPQPDANCSQILAWHTQTKIPTILRKPRVAPANRRTGRKGV